MSFIGGVACVVPEHTLGCAWQAMQKWLTTSEVEGGNLHAMAMWKMDV
jgi:hypothetical protein